MQVQKNFGSKKLLSPKTVFESKKNFGPKKVLGLKKVLGPKQVLGAKTNLGAKKDFGPKNCRVQKNFGPKKVLNTKNFWVQKNFGPKKFWSKKILSPKKGGDHSSRIKCKGVQLTKKNWQELAHFLKNVGEDPSLYRNKLKNVREHPILLFSGWMLLNIFKGICELLPVF